MTSIVIDRRFCGPPKSANGGYVCGLLAGENERARIRTERGVPDRVPVRIKAGFRGIHPHVPEARSAVHGCRSESLAISGKSQPGYSPVMFAVKHLPFTRCESNSAKVTFQITGKQAVAGS